MGKNTLKIKLKKEKKRTIEHQKLKWQKKKTHKLNSGKTKVMLQMMPSRKCKNNKEWEKIFANHLSDKGLIRLTCNILQKLTTEHVHWESPQKTQTLQTSLTTWATYHRHGCRGRPLAKADGSSAAVGQGPENRWWHGQSPESSWKENLPQGSHSLGFPEMTPFPSVRSKSLKQAKNQTSISPNKTYKWSIRIWGCSITDY